MAKLAFLICTHEHPELLGRLVRRLRHPDSFFFVFVDAKVAAAPFKAAVRGEERCRFVEPRHRVTWMGFSAVEAQLALMRAAAAAGEAFKYLVLLTGSDHPIRSTQEIHAFYGRHSCEFLKYFALDENPDWRHKVARFHALDILAFNRREVFRTTTRTVLWLPALALSRVLSRLIPRSATLDGFVLYGGSARWSLTRPCALHVLDVAARNPRVTDFFRWTHSPDELFFQTVIVNSAHRDNIVRGSRLATWSHNRLCTHVREYGDDLTYVNWQRSSGGSPATLDERDLPSLLRGRSLFARKFHPVVSRTLLDRLDGVQEVAAAPSGSLSAAHRSGRVASIPCRES